MVNHPRQILRVYGAALLAVVLAIGVRGLIDPWVGDYVPLATLYGSVALAVWVGGWRPAVLATVVGYLACDYLFIRPRGRLGFTQLHDLLGLILYLGSCAIIVGFGEALQVTRRRAEAERQEALDRQRRLERADEAARTATQHLQIVTESMAAPVTRCSRDLRYLWVSKPYADWIGRPAEEIIGRPIVDVVGAAGFGQLRPYFERVLTGQPVRYEEFVEFRGLGRRWINAVYTPTFDPAGVPDGWVAVVLDLTERRQTEEALRDSEQRFARFMHHLPGLAWVKDLEGRYVYANEAALKVFRRPPDGLYGKTDDEVFPPETAAQFHANDRQAQASEAGVQMVETLRHADGVVHHSLVSKFPIPGPDGRPALVGGMAIDITDRLRAEEALRDADRRKDEFLATLAHELRNPLAPIRNAVELLRRADHDTALMEQARAMMERQLGHMVRLIDDLLDISRITRGRLELRKEPVELAAVVRSAVEAAHPLLETRGHELTFTLPPAPVYLDADPVRLAQLFSNLLTNAAKYTEKGGHVWLTGARQDGAAVVSVRDTGIGIAPEHLQRIFEMFSQVAPALERSQGGLGIGLALVRGLAELHGGTVEAHSAGPGQGSEFVVRLPLLTEGMREEGGGMKKGMRGEGGGTKEDRGNAGGPSALIPHPSSLIPSSSSLRRVLVADDNPDVADSLALMLRLAGHAVEVAYGGVEAVQAGAAFRPEVVVLDIGMPRLNGYEVARRMRAQPWGRDVVLVALTGWGQEEDKRRAADAGFDHHLTKPVQPGVLETLLAAGGARGAPE